MTAIGRSRHRRPFTQRPFLLVVIGTVVCALVITIMQLRPESASAADTKVNDAVISELKPEVKLVGDVCRVTNTITIADDDDDELTSIRNNIIANAQGGAEIKESRTFQGQTSNFIYTMALNRDLSLADLGMSKEECTHETAVADHRGRKLFELPAWAKRILSTVAGGAAYIGVTLSFATAWAFVAPEAELVGVAIGACLGGFAWVWVTNRILDTPNDLNAVQAATNCIVNAIAAVVGLYTAKIVLKMKAGIEAFFQARSTAAAIEDAVELAEGAGGSEISESFSSAETRFSEEFESAYESESDFPQDPETP